MKVRVSYHGIEVETEIPDTGAEKHEKNALGYNTNKHDYPFEHSKIPAGDVAILLMNASVKAIEELREGQV